MAGALPSEVSAEAAEAARATLGGAVAVAEQLPGAAGAALLGPAREAFTSALTLTAATCAAVLLATAAVVAILLRPRADLGAAVVKELAETGN